jgi:hypothetical protein
MDKMSPPPQPQAGYGRSVWEHLPTENRFPLFLKMLCGIKGGSREIPYLAVGSKFHKQVGHI